MAREMSQGLKAYQLSLGRRANVLRDIFDAGPDVVPSTVEEQVAFSRKWFESIR
jgi:hypothetical protein